MADHKIPVSIGKDKKVDRQVIVRHSGLPPSIEPNHAAAGTTHPEEIKPSVIVLDPPLNGDAYKQNGGVTDSRSASIEESNTPVDIACEGKFVIIHDSPMSKMDRATEIFKRMRLVRDVTRKDIIGQFVAEVKLTQAGASTYYQMIKTKHETKGRQ